MEGAVWLRPAGVKRAHLEEDFLTGVLTHLGVPGSVTPIFESTGAVRQPRSPASVTIFLSQIAGRTAARFPLDIFRPPGAASRA